MRIQDDQVVVATYGRGIWSVQVEGIERTIVFAPIITDVSIVPSGQILVNNTIGSVFDSITFLADGQRVGSPSLNVGTGQDISPVSYTHLTLPTKA